MAINFAPPPAQPGGGSVDPRMLALMLQQGGSSGGSSDIEMALRKMMMEKYLGSVGDYSPVQHWTQGLARMANAGIAGYQMNKLLGEEKARNAAVDSVMGGIVNGGAGSGATPSPAPVPQPAPQGVPMSGGSMGALSGIGDSIASMFKGGGSPAPIGGPSAMPTYPMEGGAAPSPAPKPQGRVPFNFTPEMAGIVKLPEVAQPQAGSQPVQSGQPPIDGKMQALVKQLMAPTPVADQPAQLTGGNPRQGVDRSRIAQELQQNPALMKKFADMTYGEVRGQGPVAAQIQAESAADRALTRNIPFSQSLLSVAEDPRRGYYASDTYKRPANPQEMASFQKDILPKVLAGSEEGFNTLGFRPTGNASQLGFAQRRADQGMYDNYKWLSGVPGKGEMYALERGDAARQAKNLRSNFPAELMSPKSDAEMAMSFGPTQVASSDNFVPSGPQPPQVGQFTPGALPNVPTAAVRPTGIGAPASPAPQPMQQPQQVAQAQNADAQRLAPQIPQNVRDGYNQLIRAGARKQALELIAPYLKPMTPKYEKLNDDTLYEQNTGATKQVTSGYRQLVDPAERARYGIPKDDQRPYQVGPANKLVNPPPENRINIDQRAETAFDQASAKHMADRYNEIVKAGFDSKANRADLNALRDLGSRINTGKTAEVMAALGPYAEALGAKVDGLGEMQAYNAIVAKMAPRMRAVGSGATSDFEMRKFLEALPGIGKTPEGNAIIEQTMQALQDHQERAAEIASRAMTKELTTREADKMLRELPDPLTAWKAASKQGLGSGGQWRDMGNGIRIREKQ